jgi:hypothetical protein
MIIRRFLVVLAVFALGCPPTLRTGDDDDNSDDDDDATGDDDTGDDDDNGDDDTWGDDDDVVEVCGGAGDPYMPLASDIGWEPIGAWYEGEIGWDAQSQTLTIADASGTEHWFTLPFADYFEQVEGQGRVYWRSSGNAGWSPTAVMAIDSWSSGILAAFGYSELPDDTLSSDLNLWISPDVETCLGSPVFDKCGTWSALAMSVTMVNAWGEEIAAWLPPSQGYDSGADGVVFYNLGGRYYSEMFCTDFPETEYAWVFARVPVAVPGGEEGR